MNFEWTTKSQTTPSIMVYEANMTLNIAACEYFKDVKYALVGIDEETKQIGIKPVTKEDLDLGKYNKENLHKVAMGKSYARISNKAFIKRIADAYKISFTEKGLKLECVFDYKQHILIAQL